MTITTSRFEKQFIRDQALSIGAKRIVEIGAFKGQTTKILSSVAHQTGGRVTAIDPMLWASHPANFWEWIDGLLHPFSYEPTFWRNVKSAGHDNVRLVKKLSTDAELLAAAGNDPDLAELDFVFIDGEHTYDAVAADMANWGRRVRVGGRVLLHDVIPRFPGVMALVRELSSDASVAGRWPVPGTTIAVVDVLKALAPGTSVVAAENSAPASASASAPLPAPAIVPVVNASLGTPTPAISAAKAR